MSQAAAIIQICEQATKQEPILAGEELWGYEAEIDDKTCDDCLALHGHTFRRTPEGVFIDTETGISYAWEYQQRISQHVIKPNVHPHCRCRLVLLVVIM